jgi:hypothetical protein
MNIVPVFEEGNGGHPLDYTVGGSQFTTYPFSMALGGSGLPVQMGIATSRE